MGMTSKEKVVAYCPDEEVKGRLKKLLGVDPSKNYGCNGCGEIRACGVSIHREPCNCGGHFFPL